MEAGRLCEERECCEYGDLNWEITQCINCNCDFLPVKHHDRDRDHLYYDYYDNYDEGDICFDCVAPLIYRERFNNCLEELLIVHKCLNRHNL